LSSDSSLVAVALSFIGVKIATRVVMGALETSDRVYYI
jgi:hypothetical protein